MSECTYLEYMRIDFVMCFWFHAVFVCIEVVVSLSSCYVLCAPSLWPACLPAMRRICDQHVLNSLSRLCASNLCECSFLISFPCHVCVF